VNQDEKKNSAFFAPLREKESLFIGNSLNSGVNFTQRAQRTQSKTEGLQNNFHYCFIQFVYNVEDLES
jgi:hypothetical protein